MISPTIGRHVLYNPLDEELEGVRHAAIICKVHNDECVNLAVFDSNGVQYHRQNVALIQDPDKSPVFGECEWMPYQKGQAAKTDQSAFEANDLSDDQIIAISERVMAMMGIDDDVSIKPETIALVEHMSAVPILDVKEGNLDSEESDESPRDNEGDDMSIDDNNIPPIAGDTDDSDFVPVSEYTKKPMDLTGKIDGADESTDHELSESDVTVDGIEALEEEPLDEEPAEAQNK